MFSVMYTPCISLFFYCYLTIEYEFWRTFKIPFVYAYTPYPILLSLSLCMQTLCSSHLSYLFAVYIEQNAPRITNALLGVAGRVVCCKLYPFLEVLIHQLNKLCWCASITKRLMQCSMYKYLYIFICCYISATAMVRITARPRARANTRNY